MTAERICGNCTMTHSPSPAQDDGSSIQGGHNQGHKAPSLSSPQYRAIVSPTEGLTAVLSYLPEACVIETVLLTRKADSSMATSHLTYSTEVLCQAWWTENTGSSRYHPSS